eukprot:g50616.t1
MTRLAGYHMSLLHLKTYFVIQIEQTLKSTPKVFHDYYPVTASTAGLVGSLPVTAPSATTICTTPAPA